MRTTRTPKSAPLQLLVKDVLKEEYARAPDCPLSPAAGKAG